MKFIFLMIILNFWYFLVAILQENIGFAIATFAFGSHSTYTRLVRMPMCMRRSGVGRPPKEEAEEEVETCLRALPAIVRTDR